MTLIDYPNLVLGALRQAIAGVLRDAADNGLPGEHHFYITFRTDAEGVEIPDSLRREHPEELTIVLQHQFWDLAADAGGFSVTLRFGGAPAHLRIPYDAMTAFADPSVEFGVQLAVPAAAEGENDALDEASAADAGGADGSDDTGTVIAFDKYRKRD